MEFIRCQSKLEENNKKLNQDTITFLYNVETLTTESIQSASEHDKEGLLWQNSSTI